MPDSVIERLTNTNPDMETWWDSSPLVFEQWVQKMLSAAPAAGKAPLEAQLRRLFNPQDSTGSLFRGCTTNPPLCLEAVKSDPEYWNVRIDELISDLKLSSGASSIHRIRPAACFEAALPIRRFAWRRSRAIRNTGMFASTS